MVVENWLRIVGACMCVKDSGTRSRPASTFSLTSLHLAFDGYSLALASPAGAQCNPLGTCQHARPVHAASGLYRSPRVCGPG